MELFGWFKELPDALPDAPSVALYQADEPLEDKIRIIDYLVSGSVVAAGIGDMAVDALSEEHEEICPLGVLSDGVWAWPSHLAYYVAAHGVRPPYEFVEHMRSNGWNVPLLDASDIDRVVGELFGAQR